MPIRSLDEARQEISSIMRGISKAHEVFVAKKIALREKSKASTEVNTIETGMPPATAEQHIPSTAAIARDRFEHVDIEILAKQLLADGYRGCINKTFHLATLTHFSAFQHC
jgi:hypothetical protein